MKRTRLLPLLILSALTLAPLCSNAQVGPGGVGSITNTQLWLRSDSLIAILPLNYVTMWYDLSGHVRDFSAIITGQSVPSWSQNVRNGYPTVRFNDNGGVNGDFLGYPASIGLTGSDAATVVIVARNTTAADEQNGGLYLGQRNVGGVRAVRSYGLEYDDAVRFNGENQVFNDGHTLNDWKIVLYTNPAGARVSDYQGYLNGTLLTGGSASTTVPSLISNLALVGATQMGGSFNPAGYFSGDIMEVAVFSSQLTDAERVVLDNNLGAKYLLPIANDHYGWEVTHSHDVSGIAAYNGTTFTNAWSTSVLSVTSPDNLAEGEYMFFGHDKGNARSWTTNEVPAPGTYRLAREWRVDETGDVGTVTVNIPATSLPAFMPGYTLVGVLTDNDGDFTSGATMHRTTLVSGSYSVDLNLTTGTYVAIIAYRPEVNFTVAASSGLESVTSVTVQAYLNYNHPSDVTFSYAVTGGTATGGIDYILAPGTVTIPSGSLTGTFNLTVINDALVEPNETVIIGLSNPSPGVSIGLENSYQYTIINDDYIYVSFSSAAASGPEGNAAAPVSTPQIVISGGISTVSGSVLVSVSNGTASAGDWNQANALVLIPAGDYTTPVAIPIPAAALTILGDIVVEPDETVNLRLNTFVNVLAGSIINSVYTIINDDSATISVATATPVIPEGGPGATGAGSFIFTLTNPLATPRTISYSVTGTATSGTDFTALTGSFVMPANTITYTLNISSIADIIVEGDETVVVTITGVSGSPVITVNPTPAAIIIDDDDLPTILYTPLSVSMNEGGTATIEVWLSNPPAGSVVLNLSTTLAGHLNISPVTLTFNASNYSTHQIITLQSVENTFMGNQTGNVIISVNDALSDDPFDPLADILIPVTVINNDVASIIVTPGSLTVAENGTATFTVALSAAPDAGSVVVDMVSNNISVATINLAQLTFNSSTWNVPQTVTVTGVNNFTIPDASTTISLAVNNVLSNDSFDGLTAIVNINVTNDDVAGFIVNPLAITINEGGPAGQFTIVLTSQPTSNVVFDLINAAPVHTAHIAQVTFTPANWNIPVVVNVTALEDALDTDRTDIIAVTVNQLLSDNNFDGMATQNVTVTIEDNDPPVITGCPSNITVGNDPGLCSAVVSWVPPLSSAPMVSTHNPGATFLVGTTTVTYTSTDSDGMTSTCSFTVTVNDTEAPVVICRNTTVNLDAAGNGSVVPADLLSAVPTDNCSVASVALSRSLFTCADLGVVTVTVTVTDGSGNISTCNALVTVTDPFPASLSAGPDAIICITDPSFSISGAAASNASVLWTTSGTGSFNNPALINPVYTRGATDNTSVTLTMTGTKINGCPVILSDAMVLSFAGLPAAYAGSDKSLCSGTPDVTLTDATAANGTVAWASSGDGTFSNPSLVNPVYTFGPSDTGPVTLTMTVTSAQCGIATDDVIITFTPAPVADAGPDAALCRSEAGYQVIGASHAGGTVSWSSSGNGTFSDATIDNPYYTFGTSDYSTGLVTITMTVTGGGTCSTAVSDAIITIYPLPAIQVVRLSDISCTGLTDGEIQLSATIGQAPFSFSIDGSPFQPSGDFTGLAAGSYYFEVMDANGCISDTTLTIAEPLPFTVTLDSTANITCNAGSDGAVYITASGGTQPYSISWTGPSGFTSSTEDITGLRAGTYNLTITDLNSCATFTFSETLTEPAAIVLTSSTLSDYSGFGVSCASSADGTISVTAAGGTAPLSYLWSGPGGFTSTLNALTNLIAGTYILTITDGGGCQLTQNFTIIAPPAIQVSATTVSAACPDTPDGSIDLTATGGVGSLTYAWTDGPATADRTDVLPGDYTVRVTDSNGCMEEFVVNVPLIGEDCLRVYEIITPNDDGRNDTWKMRNAELYPDAEVFVYDRWGKLVFHTRNASDEWDGRYNGKLLPNDSYHYIINMHDGSEPRTGVISIISK
ncbi:MAG: gliding motility-associated C-terminal domain-containing protein [Bacteroidales bacterium]|jgi:gliding motility-associated-like protein|nr:gliding motility-associated C-terminal domain-containing protein [Bacteroidales bacterium]